MLSYCTRCIYNQPLQSEICCHVVPGTSIIKLSKVKYVVTLYQIPNVKYVVVRLYQERLQQIDAKLEEVKEGRAVEYLSPLAQLEENMSIYTEVAGRRTVTQCFCLQR